MSQGVGRPFHKILAKTNMTKENKTNSLYCSFIYRVAPEGPLEKVAHVCEKKDTSAYEEVVRDIVSNDLPLTSTASLSLGGFKVVQQDEFRVVYGSDVDGICKCIVRKRHAGNPLVFVFDTSHTHTLRLTYASPWNPCFFFTTGLAVVTNTSYPSRIAIELLQELYTKVPQDVLTGKTNKGTICKKDRKAMKVVHDKYSNLTSFDKVACLQGKIDVVKDQMEHNITQALENMESAETLAETAEEVTEQASVFHKNSKKLRKHMAWKNLQMTLFLGVIVAIILVVVFGPLLR
jgi:hypothetical protein